MLAATSSSATQGHEKLIVAIAKQQDQRVMQPRACYEDLWAFCARHRRTSEGHNVPDTSADVQRAYDAMQRMFEGSK